MNEKILKYLYDVKQSIDEIDSYFIVNVKLFEEYRNNVILKRAIERNLEIIGEAVNRIIKIDPNYPVICAKGIVGLRNQIIHAMTIYPMKIFGESSLIICLH